MPGVVVAIQERLSLRTPDIVGLSDAGESAYGQPHCAVSILLRSLIGALQCLWASVPQGFATNGRKSRPDSPSMTTSSGPAWLS